MRIERHFELAKLIEIQRGVITRKQALSWGLTPDAIDWLVHSKRWLLLRRGVYSTLTGELPREATLWAAVLRAGSQAVLSHQTAAELFKITDRQSSLVHVTIPAGRHIAALEGVVLHRSTRLAEVRHPTLLPPRTRIEETVLDLVNQATSFDAAFAVACAACQRRRTTPGRLTEAMTRCKKMRWRAELGVALAEIGSGVHSLLEYKYVRDVERPHGLPRATRQARVVRDGGSAFLDNLYDDYGLCVELDGREAHPDDRRWLDIRRSNAVAEEGITTVRYSWSDIDRRPCQTAAQVGAALRRRGWTGSIRRCGPACRLP
jgi:very-short-patch-repair endonuclease